MPFIKTGDGLNKYWGIMMDAQINYDTRAVYIHTFATALDSCLLDSLFERDDYTIQVKDYPIKPNSDDTIPSEIYRNWIRYFSKVLRENSLFGLVNNGADMSDDAADDFFEDR